MAALLGPAPVHEFTDRGLDHGAIIPLMAMYPAADVPVVQLSMPSLDPSALFECGARLRPRREEGILLLGSGFMTHPDRTEVALRERVPHRLLPLVESIGRTAAN